MDSAAKRDLELGIEIRVVTAVYFCATKLEAFRGRGKDDYQSSHDLEDLIAVIDGRAELLEEIRAAAQGVRAHIAAEIAKLLAPLLSPMLFPGTCCPMRRAWPESAL